MGALEYVDVPGYAAIIFRRTYTDLSLPGAIMHRAETWLKNSNATWNDTKKQWLFPSGAILQFAYLKDEGDELRYQSAEFQYVGFDELTQFRDEAQYEYLFSRIRRPAVPCEICMEALPCEDHPGAGPHPTTDPVALALRHVPLRMRAASNPGGPGHGWVKDRFPIDGVTRGRRVFIPAKIADNPHGDRKAYRASLSHLGETLRQQLEDGDWDVAEGLAYTIRDDAHLIDEFDLADSHERFEACDYGLNGAPWALWVADYEGNLIVYDLLYERDKLPSDLCPIVLARRKATWGFGHRAWADPSIWHRTGQRNKFGAPAVLADEFSDNGVPLEPANNDPRAGMTRVRELLKLDLQHRFPNWHPRAGEPGAPRLYFVREPTGQLVKELRAAPVQPLDKPDGGEKVDPAWESKHGHASAMARYAVMTRQAPSVEPEQLPEGMRERAALEFLKKRDQRSTRKGGARWA